MADGQPEDQGAQDSESQRIAAVEHQLSAVETTQAEQGSKLDQILSRLGGGGKAPAGAAEPAAEDSIAEQVRKAVEAVGAEQAEKDAADAHAADHQALKDMREKQPRDSGAAGWRGKLQRAMYGGDPE